MRRPAKHHRTTGTVGWRRLWPWALCLVGTACSASPGTLDWRIAFACQSDRANSAVVDVSIARGTCEEAAEVPVYEFRAFRSGVDPLDAPAELEPGWYALHAIAFDTLGGVTAEGCTTAHLPTSAPLDVVLHGANASGCSGNSPDAGSAADGAVPPGPTVPDAGAPAPDSGSPTPDAGSEPPGPGDAGGEVPDAGAPEPDAGGVCPAASAMAALLETTSQISAGRDDAEEAVVSSNVSVGDVLLDSSDLELTDDTDSHAEQQIVGVRFATLRVPRGALVEQALIEFTADRSDSAPTSLRVTVQASADAPPFSTDTFDLSARPRVLGEVAWNVPAWTLDQVHPTPDLSSLLQQVVCDPGWSDGNAVVVLIEGTGSREAVSFEQSPADSAVLRVRYRQ